jgi:hypothetical protein
MRVGVLHNLYRHRTGADITEQNRSSGTGTFSNLDHVSATTVHDMFHDMFVYQSRLGRVRAPKMKHCPPECLCPHRYIATFSQHFTFIPRPAPPPFLGSKPLANLNFDIGDPRRVGFVHKFNALICERSMEVTYPDGTHSCHRQPSGRLHG